MESLTFINSVYDKEKGTTQVESANYKQQYTRKLKLCMIVRTVLLILSLGLSIGSIACVMNQQNHIDTTDYSANDETSGKLNISKQPTTSFDARLLTALKQLNSTRELFLNLSNACKHAGLALQLTLNFSRESKLDLINNQENIRLISEKFKLVQRVLVGLIKEVNETKINLAAEARWQEETNYRQNLITEELGKHLLDALEMGVSIDNQSNVTKELLDSQEQQQRNFESIISNLNSQIVDLEHQTEELVSDLSAVRASVTAYHAAESKQSCLSPLLKKNFFC